MNLKPSTIAITLMFTMLCSLFPSGLSLAKENKKPVDLDMIFIGAHPDDEASGLSTYGQWIEKYNYKMGVMTVTRGEGGGNAVGPEEGSDLGILREKEERDAVSVSGINDVFNLDKVDFYYNVSAPLTEKVWEHDSTLEKVVRTVRMTKPEIIFTMNPSPTPGNHGHHQYAARMAVEAYYAAADPTMFPEQISKEGLMPWQAKKILLNRASGLGKTGEACEASFVPTESTEKVYSVWSGRESIQHNKTWGSLEREAQRRYESQGWHVFPDVPSNPNELGCDNFTEVDSRSPFTKDNKKSTALLEGALLSEGNGLPLGTELSVITSEYQVASGESFKMDIEVTNNSKENIKGARLEPELPTGWVTKEEYVSIKKLSKGETKSVSFQVTAPVNLETKRYRLDAKLSIGKKQGYSSRVVEGVSDVQANLQPLSHVKQFQSWTKENSVQNLENLIKPVFSIGTGEKKNILVNVTNNSGKVQSGKVSLQLPIGFEALEPTVSFDSLKPNEIKVVEFNVNNTDSSLKTSKDGGTNGDYDFTITTNWEDKLIVQKAAINLVPVTDIHKVISEPIIDGDAHEHEYNNNDEHEDVDLSRVWEGEAPTSSLDASGHAKVSWYNDALYFYIDVKDDKLGTVLDAVDAKRHWRTDSIEIAIDPQGQSENTSSTFKVGLFPTTTEKKPAAYRDADNHQGPIEETAPGMEIASIIDEENYNGYKMEVKVPFSVLPSAVNPEKLAFNIFIYDSDTNNKTGQTRLGWSTWGGVQGDPYRWGHGNVEGYQPDSNLPTEPKEPIIPKDVAKSVHSPQSILQSSLNGVPLASGARAEENSLKIVGKPKVTTNGVKLNLKAKNTGEANIFIFSNKNKQIIDQQTIKFKSINSKEVTLQYPADIRSEDTYLLISYDTLNGKTKSISYPLTK
jgi:LmbE family N-acetylglucosaminyl deacetylase